MPRTLNIVLSFAVLFFMSLRVSAQIEIVSDHDYRSYLQYEPVAYRVLVKSKVGQPLIINGEDGPRFYLIVRDVDGHAIPAQAAIDPDEPLMIAAQGTVLLTNYIDRVFKLTEPGQYSVQPCVDWGGKTFSGEKKHIEIVRGRMVTSLVGLVPADGTTRNFQILHVNRNQQDHLLLRIDDEAAGMTYGTFPLGRSVMNVLPRLAIDGRGDAHILFQNAPRTYLHAVFSPDGKLRSSEYFGRDYSAVSLESTPGGSIKAVGKVADEDLTKPLESVIENR